MSRRNGPGRLVRFGLHVALFIIGAMVTGAVEAVILGLTIRDVGLLIAIMAVAFIFFFEVVYQHNVRVSRIPRDQAESRASVLRVMMLPMVYLAAVGLASPFIQPPGFDSNVRLAVILGFPVLTFATVVVVLVRAWKMRRGRWTTAQFAPVHPR